MWLNLIESGRVWPILGESDGIWLNPVAGESGTFDLEREKSPTLVYRLCDARLSGQQDDFFRFGYITMLACEHTNTLGPLAAALNVCTTVLARSAEIYFKL